VASLTEIIVYVLFAVKGPTENVIELKKEGIAGEVVTPSEKVNDQGPVPVKLTVKEVVEPEQIEVVPVMAAVGPGFTVIATFCGIPAQVPADGVTTYVTTVAAVPVFSNASLM